VSGGTLLDDSGYKNDAFMVNGAQIAPHSGKCSNAANLLGKEAEWLLTFCYDDCIDSDWGTVQVIKAWKTTNYIAHNNSRNGTSVGEIQRRLLFSFE